MFYGLKRKVRSVAVYSIRVPDSETPYQDGRHRVWASAYVIDRFVNMMDTHSANNMNREVMEGLARNERGGTLGKIFECYVRHLFFKGGGEIGRASCRERV